MKRLSGWFKQSYRHQLASRGIKTKYKIPEFKTKGKRFIIVDIDGTIIDISTRWKLASEKFTEETPAFWNEMMRPEMLKLDRPIDNTAYYLSTLVSNKINIIYLSGRRDNLTKETSRFLKDNGFPTGQLILRPLGMSTREFKSLILEKVKVNNNILLSIGDRDSDEEVSANLNIPFIRVRPNITWDSKTRRKILKHL
jgi:predicted secreted acid phosphatase